MAVRNPQPGSGAMASLANLFVDGSVGGPVENGAIDTPYQTIAAGIAAMGVGDVLVIEAGTYVEDLAIVAGEDYNLKARVPSSVIVEGSMTIEDATVVLEGLHLVDDGAGGALLSTGVAADTVRLLLCELEATAGGGVALDHDNTAGTLELQGCSVITDVANANECVAIQSGTCDILESDIVHGSNVAEALVCEGDAATAFTMRDCRCTGSVNSEAAVANPTMYLEGCNVTVGAISGVIVAAANTVELTDVTIDSTDAGDLAVDGAGTVILKDVRFPNTADEIAGTLTATHVLESQTQSIRVAHAGGAGDMAVAFVQDFPTVNWTFSVAFDDTAAGAALHTAYLKNATKAVGGCTMTASGNGTFHIIARHD